MTKGWATRNSEHQHSNAVHFSPGVIHLPVLVMISFELHHCNVMVESELPIKMS